MLTQCITYASKFLRYEEIRYVATSFKYIVCGGTEGGGNRSITS